MITRAANKTDFNEMLSGQSITYYNWDYIDDVSKMSGFKNISLFITDANNKYIIPLIQRKILGFYPVAFSIPFGLYGGIMSRSNIDAKIYTALMECARKYLNMGIIFQNVFQEKLMGLTNITKIASAAAHMVNTENLSYDDYFQNDCEYKIRKNVKRAIENNVTVNVGNSTSLIKDYYRLYKISNSRWGRKEPRYDVGFFEAFANKDYFELRVAYYKEQPAAGLVMLKFKNYYFGWFGGMDKELSNSRANDYLHVHLIKDCIENNCRIVNFGSSGKLSGVRKFKESFGAKESAYSIYFMGNPVVEWVLQLIVKLY